MTAKLDFVPAVGFPSTAGNQSTMTKTAVSATMVTQVAWHAYSVTMRIVLPPTFAPLTRLQPHQLPAVDFEQLPRVTFEKFMAESTRINAELNAIVDIVAREWRQLSAAEQRRFDDLNREFDELTAAMERPFAHVQ